MFRFYLLEMLLLNVKVFLNFKRKDITLLYVLQKCTVFLHGEDTIKMLLSRLTCRLLHKNMLFFNHNLKRIKLRGPVVEAVDICLNGYRGTIKKFYRQRRLLP